MTSLFLSPISTPTPSVNHENKELSDSYSKCVCFGGSSLTHEAGPLDYMAKVG